MEERSFFSVVLLLIRSFFLGLAVMLIFLMGAAIFVDFRKQPSALYPIYATFLIGFFLSWVPGVRAWKKTDRIKKSQGDFPANPPKLKNPPVEEASEALKVFDKSPIDPGVRLFLIPLGYVPSSEQIRMLSYELSVAAWSLVHSRSKTKADPTDVLELVLNSLESYRKDELLEAAHDLEQLHNESVYLTTWGAMGIPFRKPFRDGALHFKVQTLVRLRENMLAQSDSSDDDGLRTIVVGVSNRVFPSANDTVRVSLVLHLQSKFESWLKNV